MTINGKWGVYWTTFLVAILIELGVQIQNVFQQNSGGGKELRSLSSDISTALVADTVRLVLMAVSLVLIQLMSAVPDPLTPSCCCSLRYIYV